MYRRMLTLCMLPMLMAIGCQTTSRDTTTYARPPQIVHRASWTRRLPGGSFRVQTPSRIGLLVTGLRLASAEEVNTYLKEEERRAWEKSGSSQVHCHFYVDGEGTIYEGRTIECEAPAVANHDPEGLVWIAFLDSNLDIYVREEARLKLVHLLTYLCFSYNISPDQLLLECETEAKSGRLCLDLGGTLVGKEVTLALTEAEKQINESPNAYFHHRTRQLRTEPSPE